MRFAYGAAVPVELDAVSGVCGVPEGVPAASFLAWTLRTKLPISRPIPGSGANMGR